MNTLFSPYTIKEMTLKNRIVMSPMCMYSAMNEDGKITNWHKIHYTTRAVGQAGLIIIEATAVTPQGRISTGDLGLWNEEQRMILQELVQMIHEQDGKVGIQLAHAGRKAMIPGPIIAPSALPFNEKMAIPEEMSQDQMKATILAFKQAAERAQTAGVDCIEIHAAHGYLINEFLSPLTNLRNDEYGGNRDKRYQFLHEIIESVRSIWSGPLFVRISANDYHPEGNQIEDYVYYAAKMKQQGVDLIDCSSGAVVPAAIETYPGYQVPYAEKIRKETSIATGAVGLITDAVHAEEIIRNERADLVFLARELLRDPYWPRKAAKQLGVSLPSPRQYERGWN